MSARYLAKRESSLLATKSRNRWVMNSELELTKELELVGIYGWMLQLLSIFLFCWDLTSQASLVQFCQPLFNIAESLHALNS